MTDIEKKPAGAGRIAKAFSQGTAFIGFVTAGDPSLDATEAFVLEMARSGAGLIELGIPFSDPIAEGQVIQDANIRSLSAGTTVEKVFKLAGRLRGKTEVPLVFLTYFNPVFRYGCEAFFARCRAEGVDGVIIPDLPFEERDEALFAARAESCSLISLIAPTSGERIAAIAQKAEGFIYIVSSLGVTGVRGEITTDLGAIVRAVKAQTDVPCAVGFGINTPEQAAAIGRIADGVIVGSALVKIIAQHGEKAVKPVGDYVRRMTAALI